MEILYDSLLASGMTAALTTGLALILYSIDRLVNNYGDVVITINEGSKVLNVKGGSTVLNTLAQQGIFLPSACGGRGSCAACKVQVLTDVGPLLPTETPHLTPAEQAGHVRLGCQIKIKKDLALAMPEELFNIKQFKCTVEKMEDLTYDIKCVYMRIKGDDNINFKAGQYAQIVVPKFTWRDVVKSVGQEKADIMKKDILAYNERMGVANREGVPSFVFKGETENPEAIQRAYSMSNQPSDDKHIEMMIRWVPAGASSTYVHTLMKEGQDIDCVGPFGHFYLRETKATMVCVAGGSGMAPIKSILLELYEKGERDRQVWYFFGARTRRDLFMDKELEELASKMSNFHFIPALSNPTPEDNWTGESGIVTAILDKYIKNSIEGDPSTFEGYLCGSAGMLDACMKVMRENNMDEEKIYYDKF